MRPDSWNGHPVHSKKGRIVDNYDRFKERPIVGLELLVHGPTLWGWLSTMLDVYATNRIIDEYVWTHTIEDTKARCHYSDVIMGPIASQIISLTIVYSIVYSDADQRKHQSSVLRAFPRTNGQLRGKCFHLMTSSCIAFYKYSLAHFCISWKCITI